MSAAACEPLVPARLEFTAQGVPFSSMYQDAYYPSGGPFAQAEQVFLRGNDLPERWRGRRQFTVCETGFGLGANFLATWDAWRSDPNRSEYLHFVSVEAHPFSQSDLAAVYSCFPPLLQPLAAQLLEVWPILVPGVHRLELQGGQVTLTLVFGSAQGTMRELQCRADAFYLDGFAPRCNPDIWSRAVLGQLVRLAAPGATLASGCCVGQVRRDLSSVGFEVRKTLGVGGRPALQAVLRPHLGHRDAVPAPGRVAVVGAGLAGAACAWELARRGQSVLVCDPVLRLGRDGSHQGHRLAAISPVFALDDAPLARLSRNGVLRAWQGWKDLPEPARPRRTGTLLFGQAGNSDAAIQEALMRLQLAPEWVQWWDRQQASQAAGVSLARGGLYFPQGMVVDPGALVAQLLNHPLIECVPERVQVWSAPEPGYWDIHREKGTILERTARVVVAAAGRSMQALHYDVLAARVLPRLAAMQDLAGQVSYLPADRPLVGAGPTLSGMGYVLPADQYGQVIGSTYLRDGQEPAVTQEGHADTLAKLGQMLSHQADLSGLMPCSGWAGWRAALNDHLPVMGGVPGHPGLFMAAAYGSRGLTWSLLAGGLLAARWMEEPVPLERRLEQAVRPR
ncbi:MAG TPA: FAD-dependent 5-carboxymethylaminomethyl-2-thiouridine(34) oxidoreductase MnmC [Alcaligenes sp.]|nr:FAD-dependent 5-carboxymethylaminomethyl-2-thiouridine(34) oxidoreductase MnmC [Alcaligenes sp.]HRL27218.1 FAD-dependent 5-carboxymethylaminomethyl-2-thiouridine(34) oxidoreductase MnmC [Alcaligenes sp.]